MEKSIEKVSFEVGYITALIEIAKTDKDKTAVREAIIAQGLTYSYCMSLPIGTFNSQYLIDHKKELFNPTH